MIKRLDREHKRLAETVTREEKEKMETRPKKTNRRKHR
jgi:hypothetical protein